MKINFNMDLINELTRTDPKSLIERTLKLSEENGEVSEAVLSYGKVNGSQYKNKKIEDVEEECLDVIMVALSIISQVNNNEITEEKIKCIEELFETKLKKWEDKNCKGGK